jgi:trypsin-like peptidase
MRATPAVRAFLFAIALAQAARPQSSQQTSGDVSEIVKSSIDAVVLIVVNDASGKPTLEGSGFLVSSDGRIVTNHHVIAGATSATVKLNNGAFFPVEGLIADDPEHDLAVIKVNGKNLPHLSLHASDNLALGQHVLAIGSPLGLENSVSDGIISGFRKDEKGVNWIQTTAPASHGNSGGPLLVMDGNVIGVLTWKAGEGENLNFAVPSSSILPLLTNSTVQPLATAAKPLTTSLVANKERIWTSMTTGRDFKVRIDGDYIYTEWVNLPSQLQTTAAFMRSELKKDGDKWVGKVRSLLPYDYKTWAVQDVKWCTVEVQFEIDKLSETRIEGRAVRAKSFDAKKCKTGELEWQSFAWIPK